MPMRHPAALHPVTPGTSGDGTGTGSGGGSGGGSTGSGGGGSSNEDSLNQGPGGTGQGGGGDDDDEEEDGTVDGVAGAAAEGAIIKGPAKVLAGEEGDEAIFPLPIDLSSLFTMPTPGVPNRQCR